MSYIIAICDDEPAHIEKIRTILFDYETVSYADPVSLLKAVSDGARFDVLFLDIMMPQLDGISLARELREYDVNMLIVFITSKIEFMQVGYEVRAFRYLLKEQIEDGLPKIWRDIEKELSDRQDDYFTYESEHKTSRVPLGDILYFESRLRRIFIHTKTSEQTSLYGKLDEIAEKYSAFIRIHQSYLVNRRYIRTVCAGTVVLSTGDILPVSRKYASQLGGHR